MLVLDDQMLDAARSTEIAKCFVQGSQHQNLSMFYLVQNIFDKRKDHRTLILKKIFEIIV